MFCIMEVRVNLHHKDEHQPCVKSRTAPAWVADSFYHLYGKRLLDLALVLLFLPVWAPLIGLLWLLARADGGPGFHIGKRMGKGGRLFNCLKVRTMVVGAEKKLNDYLARNPEMNEEYKRFSNLHSDPRITWAGRFLRRSSLDELPQLWNVLKGEMSLVGPRPFPAPGNKCNSSDSDWLMYHSMGLKYLDWVRPGITGPMQTGGRHRLPLRERMQLNVYYSERISLRLDLFHLLKTVKVVLEFSGT